MDKQLITLINKLQDVFATVGVSSDSINLPQITVGAFEGPTQHPRWQHGLNWCIVAPQSGRSLRASRV